MAEPLAWVFRQLDGPKKTLVLDGSAAPYGGPRRGSMTSLRSETRQFKRRYPGGNAMTRHVFGSNFQPAEFHGRLMDVRLGGRGTAQEKRQEMEAFRADLQPVIVTWGNEVAWTGFVDWVEFGIESETDFTWSMGCDVDERFDVAATIVRTSQMPADYTDRIKAYFASLYVPEKLTLRLSLLDALSLLLSNILAPLTALNALANDMAAFKDAAIGEIRRFRAALGLLRTALATFRDTVESVGPEFMLEIRAVKDVITTNPWQSTGTTKAIKSSFDSTTAAAQVSAQQATDASSIAAELNVAAAQELQLGLWQSSGAVAILNMLNEIAEADRAAARAEFGQVKGILTAQPGDTWESLSIQAYGDASRAKSLREANDAGTANPVAGETYVAPK